MTAPITPETATVVVAGLFRKYGITDPTQASRLVRERFTQHDLDTYKAARDYLDGMGALDS